MRSVRSRAASFAASSSGGRAPERDHERNRLAEQIIQRVEQLLPASAAPDAPERRSILDIHLVDDHDKPSCSGRLAELRPVPQQFAEPLGPLGDPVRLHGRKLDRLPYEPSQPQLRVRNRQTRREVVLQRLHDIGIVERCDWHLEDSLGDSRPAVPATATPAQLGEPPAYAGWRGLPRQAERAQDGLQNRHRIRQRHALTVQYRRRRGEPLLRRQGRQHRQQMGLPGAVRPAHEDGSRLPSNCATNGSPQQRFGGLRAHAQVQDVLLEHLAELERQDRPARANHALRQRAQGPPVLRLIPRRFVFRARQAQIAGRRQLLLGHPIDHVAEIHPDAGNPSSRGCRQDDARPKRRMPDSIPGDHGS